MITALDADDVAVLARQSTSKAAQAESIPKQRELLEAFAAEIGWPFPKNPARFYEAIVSGMSPGRPELERLVQDIKAGNVRRVMVYDVSRVSRSILVSNGLFNVFREQETQLAVHSFRRVINLNSDDDHTLSSMGFIFSETHWANHARGIREGMRRLANHGRWLTSTPFGFKKVGGILEPDPVTAPLLFRQLELSRLYGFREASRILKGEGQRVAPSTLQHRFHNRVYQGILRYGATRMAEIRNPHAKFGELPWRAQVPAPDETIVVEKAFQAPVPMGLWHDESLERESRRNNRNGAGLRKSLGAFFLSGLAVCAICGKSIRAFSTVRRRADGTAVPYYYVGCRTKGCQNSSRPRERVERRFEAVIRRLLAEPEMLRLRLRSTLAMRVSTADGRRGQLEARKDKLKESLERLQTAFAEEIENDPVLEAARNGFHTELAELDERLDADERLRNLSASLEQALPNLISWMSDLQGRRTDAGHREFAIFLRRALAKVEISADLQLQLFFRRPLPAAPPA